MGKKAKKGYGDFDGEGYNKSVSRQGTDGTGKFKKSFKYQKNSDSHAPVIRYHYFVDPSWEKNEKFLCYISVLMDMVTLLGNRLSLKQQNTLRRLQTFLKAKGWMWRNVQSYVVVPLRKLEGRN